ncbi:MAG: FAD-dependent oxidoreductase, partial [bacterium]|nr:FAD-dependent oxidoreductase [bacterium]
MGFKVLDLKMPTDFTREELKRRISKKLRIKGFTFNIEKQGLDARKKTNIQWTLRVAVSSPALPGTNPDNKEHFFIPSKKREKRVIVVGSGPAGFFAAYTLLKAGFDVTILEQGKEVGKRFKDILHFEESGELDESSNYAFGEGGAGTFSDGKLTSRTKSISRERKFIFDTYIEAGAPSEIAYLSHPHLGSDNLRKIVKNLRKLFTGTGGTILFGARVTDIHIKDGKVTAVETDQGKHEAHYFIFAAGHSSYDTYGLLIKRGVPFEAK